MSDESTYRGAIMRRHYRDGEPYGWWLMPEGPLRAHLSDRWVRTIEEGHAEIDQHLLPGGGCLLDRRGGHGAAGGPTSVGERLFDRTMLQGFSAWCAVRYDQPHEPCTTRGCPCGCHAGAADPPPRRRIF